MVESADVTCPYCGERVELLIDPETAGTYVEDCEVCCNPWQVSVERDEGGRPAVAVERAQ